MTRELSFKAYAQCLLRGCMLNFLYTEQGLQSIGFLQAILPGLRSLYKDQAAFAAACARYSRRFNCHLFWAPFLAGSFLHLERSLRQSGAPPDFALSLREAALNSLSAIGDSFFSGSLAVSTTLAFSCLVLLQQPGLVAVLFMAWLLLSLILKAALFHLGLTRGLPALRLLTRLALVNKGEKLKLANAALLLCFLALLSAPAPLLLSLEPSVALERWFLPLGLLLGAGLAASSSRLPRTPAALGLFALIAVLI